MLFLLISLLPVAFTTQIKPELSSTSLSLQAAHLFFAHDNLNLYTAKEVVNQDTKVPSVFHKAHTPSNRLKQSNQKQKPIGYDSRAQRVARHAAGLLKKQIATTEGEAMRMANKHIQSKISDRNEQAKKFRFMRQFDPEQAKNMKQGQAKSIGYSKRKNVIERHANRLLRSGVTNSKEIATALSEEHFEKKKNEKRRKSEESKKSWKYQS